MCIENEFLHICRLAVINMKRSKLHYCIEIQANTVIHMMAIDGVHCLHIKIEEKNALFFDVVNRC